MARFTLALILIITLATPFGARAQDGGFQSRWTSAIAAVEIAALRGDTAALERALADVVALRKPATDPRARALVLYGAAYTRWRMAVMQNLAEKKKDQMLETAIVELEEAITLNPAFADAHSLKSSVFGLQIGTSMWRGMTLGPKAGAATSKAKELEPANPRVILSEGVGAFHAPAMFGGGQDKAENLLRQALFLFEKEPRDKPWPNWGRFDTHAWLGQILVTKGDLAGARTQYESARAEAPESGWLRYVLIPALEKAEKTRRK